MTHPTRQAARTLAATTVAFATCFAAWVMYGVLLTFLVEQGVFSFTPLQTGILVGTPIFAGAWLGLVGGVLAERFGGRAILAQVLMISAAACLLTSMAESFLGFLLCGLGIGIAGASFSVGIATLARWYPQHRRGTALGVFGGGMLGASFTTLLGPTVLTSLVAAHGLDLGWRLLPRVYGAVLLVVLVGYWLATVPAPATTKPPRSWREQLRPLGDIRAWRFGLYYFTLFGAFLSLSQMLVPYLVGVYGVSLATAGLLATCFILPSGVARAAGGWLSDRIGARSLMYVVLTASLVIGAFLALPPMVVDEPGGGAAMRMTLMAEPLPSIREGLVESSGGLVRLPLGVFGGLVLALGVLLGSGCAAVYKHIPDYFPERVGTVGALVSVAGGMGGFCGPIVSGWLVTRTGLWTMCWVPLVLLCAGSLLWMHVVIQRTMHRHHPGGHFFERAHRPLASRRV